MIRERKKGASKTGWDWEEVEAVLRAFCVAKEEAFLWGGAVGGYFGGSIEAMEEAVVPAPRRCLISWPKVSLMIQRVLADPDWSQAMTAEDLKSLTPLIFSHVNPYGTFHLDMQERIPLEA